MKNIMKQILVFFSLFYLSGCAKQQAQPQPLKETTFPIVQKIRMEITIDSLNKVIRDLEGQSAKNNSNNVPEDANVISQAPLVNETSSDNKYSTWIGEWKKARNGTSVKVKWKLTVHIGFSNEANCWFMKDGKPDYDHIVNLRQYGNGHSDDVLIVTGEALGANGNGYVYLYPEKIVNKGAE